MTMEEPLKSALPKPPHRHRRHHVVPMPLYQQKPHPRSGLCCSCCLYILLFLFLLTTFFATTGAILYAWLHPCAPEFRIERFNITHLSVTSRKDGFTYLTSGIDLLFEAWNRNDVIQFNYDRMYVVVYNDDDSVRLGQTMAPPFVLVEHNMTVVRVGGVIVGAVVSPHIGKEILQQVKEKRLAVDIQLETILDFVVGKWNTGGFPIRVLCGNVEISRLASDFEPKCVVYLYGWIPM